MRQSFCRLIPFIAHLLQSKDKNRKTTQERVGKKTENQACEIADWQGGGSCHTERKRKKENPPLDLDYSTK